MSEALQRKIMNKEAKKYKHGELRCWWVPQVPMRAFHVLVTSLVEARLVLDTLARYDLFQLENKVKPDYSNAGGLQIFDANDKTDSDGGSWVDWYSDEGEDINQFELEELRVELPEWEGLNNE